MKEGKTMTTRSKRWWQVIGMGAVTLLLLAVVLAVGLHAGPDEQAPGPEKYYIVHDERQGLQTEAVFLNASPAATYLDDPQLGPPYITIHFGKASSETYDMEGMLMFYTEPTDDGLIMLDAAGNVLGSSHDTGPAIPMLQPEHPLYSYRWSAAISPYWMALLQQG